MPTRSATTDWQGGLEDGSGKAALTNSGAASFEVSFPRRAADDADGVTSPEELIAAAHTSCLAMQLSALIGEHGATPGWLRVTADVGLGPDPAGGFRLTGIEVSVEGHADGLDAAEFETLARTAKESCPVSKALSGVQISLTTSFAPA